MLYPFSFIYVWTTIEHQVQDVYATQKFQTFSSFRRPKTHFQHHQGSQQAAGLTSSINIIQDTNITSDGVELRKAVAMKKTCKTD